MKGSTPLKVLGWLLMVVGIAWMVYSVAQGEIYRPAPAVLGFGNGFDLPTVSADEAKAAFMRAEATMTTKNRLGGTWSLWSHIAGWASFLLTATITLVAGYYGRNSGDSEENPQSAAAALQADPPEGGRRVKRSLVRIIGLMAALASVMTGLSSRFGAAADGNYKKADVLRKIISESRKELLNDQVNAARATEIISDLESVRQRYE